MSIGFFNPERAEGERAVHRVIARETFRQSGIVEVVDRVKGLLPEGTEIKIYDGNEDGVPPHIALIGPERDGVRTRFVYGDIGGSDWFRLSPVNTLTRERMLLGIGVFGVNPSMLDFDVRRSVVEPLSRLPQPLVSLVWSGIVGDVSEEDQLKRRLHYGLKRAFTFPPNQDRELQQLLPPASPVRVATYSYGKLVEVG